ncbi:MAG: glycoside hydrolase family 3 N-terminal domain-containing protein, partial [Nakamurella sp.]
MTEATLQPGGPAAGPDTELETLADGVLMPCFDGTSAPEWVLRRVSGGLGGVCLFARNIGTPEQLRALTDSLLARRSDLVIAVDEEAGDVTRLDAATGSRFPGSAALGKADDVELTREIGHQVGVLLRQAGITLNFAPSADVAVDRSNPVVGTRSFGDDPDLVSRHAAAFLTGQQSAGVHACVKHFPGHGDTATDSHLSIAVVATSRDELTRVALPPFRAAIAAGVAA